ncbi:HAMP domain-containing sensor histidine kinase [Streptomyces sp. NBC_00878]|uniref:HAMP domain-containing sensor histidine kinase n=1 Tax=Streptomyces sp. NBC_00878 TaxID=2975854 RepID=UPI00224F36D5|nr:HAMP domain-containing sensor histidine kinase [Streptomyces sp. NBC_00878]MCX4911201.1 HAMP domain-containing histidine kinase [Streptomyces sp. NBC_00878]
MRLVPRGLRARITVSVALLVTVVVALAGLAIVTRIDHRDRTDVDRQLTARAEKVQQDADKLLEEGDHHSGDEGQDDYGGLLTGSQSLVRVISGRQVIAQRGETPRSALPVPERDGYATLQSDGQTWRSLTEPLNNTGDRVELLQDIHPIERRLADNIALVAAVTLLAAAVTAIGTWLITRLLLHPLQRLRAGALAISADVTGPALPAVDRPREVADLSHALNAMLDQLRTSMEATRRFTADAGHELRTPLTTLGMTLETLQRNPDLPEPQRTRALEAMRAEHRRITTLLTGLQSLARGDAHALPGRTPVDLTALLAEAVQHAARRHPTITYRLGPAAPVTIQGWPAGLRLAVDNLLDNAALHGRAEGNVDIGLSRQGATLRIAVSDDGPGIAPDQRQAMKERFTRGARTHAPGSGLGLALVEQQAQLHHGTLHLGQSPSGGLQAIVSLPSAPDPGLDVDDSGPTGAPVG